MGRYVQKQEAKYAEEVRKRQENQRCRRAREMGYTLNKVEPKPSEPTPTTTDEASKAE